MKSYVNNSCVKVKVPKGNLGHLFCLQKFANFVSRFQHFWCCIRLALKVWDEPPV